MGSNQCRSCCSYQPQSGLRSSTSPSVSDHMCCRMHLWGNPVLHLATLRGTENKGKWGFCERLSERWTDQRPSPREWHISDTKLIIHRAVDGTRLYTTFTVLYGPQRTTGGLRSRHPVYSLKRGLRWSNLWPPWTALSGHSQNTWLYVEGVFETRQQQPDSGRISLWDQRMMPFRGWFPNVTFYIVWLTHLSLSYRVWSITDWYAEYGLRGENTLRLDCTHWFAFKCSKDFREIKLLFW